MCFILAERSNIRQSSYCDRLWYVRTCPLHPPPKQFTKIHARARMTSPTLSNGVRSGFSACCPRSGCRREAANARCRKPLPAEVCVCCFWRMFSGHFAGDLPPCFFHSEVNMAALETANDAASLGSYFFSGIRRGHIPALVPTFLIQLHCCSLCYG